VLGDTDAGKGVHGAQPLVLAESAATRKLMSFNADDESLGNADNLYCCGAQPCQSPSP
jgi:hypothetical protein